MTVYVDDAGIPAEVRNGSRVHRSGWSHLTAGTQEELHEFASRLGLRRSYFQPGRPLGGKPSPFWHYDLTAGKRAQALRLGARAVSWRDLPGICRAREAGRQTSGTGTPDSDIRGGTRAGPAARRHGRYYPPDMTLPEGICPRCRSSALTAGRPTCQACGALEVMAAAPPRAVVYPDLSHGQPGHMCVLPGAGRKAEAGS
jgi:Protein of unknown function (DUF4031)